MKHKPFKNVADLSLLHFEIVARLLFSSITGTSSRTSFTKPWINQFKNKFDWATLYQVWSVQTQIVRSGHIRLVFFFIALIFFRAQLYFTIFTGVGSLTACPIIYHPPFDPGLFYPAFIAMMQPFSIIQLLPHTG